MLERALVQATRGGAQAKGLRRLVHDKSIPSNFAPLVIKDFPVSTHAAVRRAFDTNTDILCSNAPRALPSVVIAAFAAGVALLLASSPDAPALSYTRTLCIKKREKEKDRDKETLLPPRLAQLSEHPRAWGQKLAPLPAKKGGGEAGALPVNVVSLKTYMHLTCFV